MSSDIPSEAPVLRSSGRPWVNNNVRAKVPLWGLQKLTGKLSTQANTKPAGASAKPVGRSAGPGPSPAQHSLTQPRGRSQLPFLPQDRKENGSLWSTFPLVRWPPGLGSVSPDLKYQWEWRHSLDAGWKPLEAEVSTGVHSSIKGSIILQAGTEGAGEYRQQHSRNGDKAPEKKQGRASWGN